MKNKRQAEDIILIKVFFQAAREQINGDKKLKEKFEAVARQEQIDEMSLITNQIALTVAQSSMKALQSRNPLPIMEKLLQEIVPKTYKLGDLLAETILRLDPADQEKLQDVVPDAARNAAYCDELAAQDAPSLAKFFAPKPF